MKGAEQPLGEAPYESKQEGLPNSEPPRGLSSQPYAVPTYRAGPGQVWYHFLHGNVPNHEIDFMYRPEVPQGSLSRTHFGHLARLMKYIEPQANKDFAFTIGNLSRDDTAREPGRGGFALIFGFRIRGVTDHAGRRDPPFAHGMATVDRRMDYGAILSATLSFFQLLFGKGEYDHPSSVLYREYVRYALSNPSVLDVVLRAYVGDFEGVPAPEKSNISLRFRAEERIQPKRILIVHEQDTEFGDIAECAARIAAVLYASDIRWTSITTGRDAEVPGGVVLRFVPKDGAGMLLGASGDSSDRLIALEDIPFDEAELAEKLFGASAVVGANASDNAAKARGWREQYGGVAPEIDGREAKKEAEKSRAQQALLEEPPREFQASTRLSPDEIRAAIGLAPKNLGASGGRDHETAQAGSGGLSALLLEQALLAPKGTPPPRDDSAGSQGLGLWIGLGIGLIFVLVAVALMATAFGDKQAETGGQPALSAERTQAESSTAKSPASAAPSTAPSLAKSSASGEIIFDPASLSASTAPRPTPAKPTRPRPKKSCVFEGSLDGCKK